MGVFTKASFKVNFANGFKQELSITDDGNWAADGKDTGIKALGFRFMGSCTQEDLPETGEHPGDFWFIDDLGIYVAWGVDAQYYEISAINVSTIGSLSELKTDDKTSVVNAINEVFQSASDGKNTIAKAITGKGIDASASDTWDELAAKISQIETETPVVGAIGPDNSITLNNLASGTYILKYEDADGTPLAGWADICSMEA